MNLKQLKKRRLELITQRRAALNKLDAVIDVYERSADKKPTDAQKAEIAGFETELRALETQIEATESRIERAETQENLERSGASAGGANDGADDDEDADDDATRLEELEERADANTITTAERRELRRLRASAEEGGARTQINGSELLPTLSAKELRSLQGYSFLRAFNARLDGSKLDGIEGEMHTQGETQYRDSKIDRNGGNLIIPPMVLQAAGCRGSMEYRDLTVTGTTAVAGDQGGMLVATQLGSLIDRLRKKLIMQRMGVTMLGGLVGNIEFPKVTPDDQAVEKAENAVSAESSATFSKIALAPRRLPVFAEVSRQLLLQKSVDVEAWLRNDLAFQIAQVMDLRAISGTGVNMPTGILNTVGVGAVALGANGTAPTWDMLVDLETLVANLDADTGALGYITNTKVRGKLKKTLVAANTAGEMIWDKRSPASPLNEYPVGITNQVPSNLVKGASGAVCSAMAFGNYNDALMGQWGGLEFLINPYSRDTEGLIRLNCWTFFDFIVRRAESFAVCKDILTT